MTENVVADPKVAADIMGAHYLSLEQMEMSGQNFSPAQKERLRTHIPFPQWALEVCCKSHILFPSVEETINEMRQKYPELFREKGDEYCMEQLDGLPFANHRGVSRWNLMRKSPVRAPTDAKTLYDHEVVADVNTVIQSVVHWYRTRQRWLYDDQEMYLSCADIAMDDGYVTVGTTPSTRQGEPGKIWMYDLWKNQPRDVLLFGQLHKFGIVYSFINRCRR